MDIKNNLQPTIKTVKEAMDIEMNSADKKILLCVSPNYSMFMLDEEISNLKKGESDFTKDVDWRPAIPLGILYLAGTLRKKGISVEILDLHRSFYECRVSGYFMKRNLDDFFRDYFTNYLIDNDFDIVGISSLFNVSFTAVARMTKHIRDLSKNTKIILGGHFPSNEYRTIFKNEDIDCDYIVLGEGEELLVWLIENLENKDIRQQVEEHPHIVDKFSYDKIQKHYNTVTSLDNLAEPAYDKLPHLEEYITGSLHAQRMGSQLLNDVRSAELYTSRGCPLKCTFCASWKVHGRKVRYHSNDYLFKHIDDLVNRFDINQLLIEDDMFNLKKDRVIELCKGISDKYGDRFTIEFPNGLAGWLLNEEVIYWLKKAGMKTITVAVESGSPYVQKHILKKNLKLPKMVEVVEMLKSFDINTRAFFIVGFIGETLEQMEESIRFALKLDVDWTEIKVLTPLAGSEMYELAIERGHLDAENEDFSEHVYGRSCLNTPEFTAEQVKNVQYDGNIRVNFLNNRALRTGNYLQAEKTFKGLVGNYPNHLFAQWGLWKALLGLEKHDEASNILEYIQNLCIADSKNVNLMKKYNLELPVNLNLVGTSP